MRFIGAWYWVAHNGNCPCNLPNLPNLFKCIQLSVNNETFSFYLQRARAHTHTYRERERVRLHWLLILSSVPCWVSRKDHKQLSCTWQFPLLMWHQQLCLPHQILPGIRYATFILYFYSTTTIICTRNFLKSIQGDARTQNSISNSET